MAEVQESPGQAMTADDLLTRLRGRLTDEWMAAFLGHDPTVAEIDRARNVLLETVRPECEAIAQEMADLRAQMEAWPELVKWKQRAKLFKRAKEAEEKLQALNAPLTAKLEAAESSRVALRQALQRVVDEFKATIPGERSDPSIEAAEALLAHEPAPVSPSD